MSIPRDIVRNNKELDEWCVMSCYRGSIAHGMYVPDSIDDKDAMAVCIPPIEYYLGRKSRYWYGKGTVEIKHNEWDIVIYELGKMIDLLRKGNPNVLMALWLDENNYIRLTRAWRLVIESRDLFAGKHVYRSFTGYAYGQLKRMTSYNKEGYMGQKRKQLVDKFGYDTKNAAHLIRLLRMGIEFLNDGQLYVTRHDASQLLEIKKGKWSLQQVKDEADRLFRTAEHAYICSELPPSPDYDRIDDLAIDVISCALEDNHGTLLLGKEMIKED